MTAKTVNNADQNRPAPRNTLSVLIPAYNQPDYLRKCLQSISAQCYRPIQVIVSDDQSPNSLKHVVEEVRKTYDSGMTIQYMKPSENLRPYWNVFHALAAATGKYAIFMAHDDWMIDPRFFEESVSKMEGNEFCYICIGNSAIEYSDHLMMKQGSKDWVLLDGKEFVAQRLYVDLHPAYSAVVFDLEKLLQLNYMKYLIEKKDAKIMGIEPDEGFLMINLLATSGCVAVTGKVVSVRGNPPGSYSKSKFWLEHGNLGLFILNFRLYRHFTAIGLADCARRMRKNLLITYPANRYNRKILEYLNFERSARLFMVVGVCVNWCKIAPLLVKALVKPVLKPVIRAIVNAVASQR